MTPKTCGCSHNLANRLSDACKDQKRINDCAKRAQDSAGGEPSPLPRSPLDTRAPAPLAATVSKR
jgi:hypothetical protein